MTKSAHFSGNMICDLNYPDAESDMKLKSQVFIKLEKIVIHSCLVCRKVFNTLDELNEHISVHDPKNIDLQNDQTMKHIRSAFVLMDRTKSFLCEHCGVYFQHCRDYKLHKLTHVQQAAFALLKGGNNNNNSDRFVKLYKCWECDLRFVARSTLLAHAEAHEPMSHKCHCGIAFYKNSDLTAHKKLVHPDYKEPKIEIEEKELIRTQDSFAQSKIKAKLKSKKRSGDSKKRRRVRNRDVTNDRTNKDVLIERIDENKYVCPICKKILSSKKNVFIHLRTHTGERPYHCKQCDKSFTQLSSLSIHEKRHTGQKDYACDYCGKRFYQKAAQIQHLRVHTKEKPHKCSYCEKPFSDKSALIRHHRIHTGYKPYQCPLCTNSYSDASALITHKNRHLNLKPEQCSICLKKFPNKHNLRKHIKVIHTDVRDHECLQCGKQFALKEYLKLHMRHQHTPKMYNCSSCMESFDSRPTLADHCGSVHGCEECMRAFPGNLHLQQHVRAEPGARFECDYCGADYNIKSYLQVHILKLHSKWRCSICRKRFMSKSELLKHNAKTCLGCTKCKRTFSNIKTLKLHVKLDTCKDKIVNYVKKPLKLICDACGHEFYERRGLIHHIRQVHTIVLYCSKCPEKFYSDKMFQYHQSKGCKQVECDICGKVLLNEALLEKHLMKHAVG